VAEDLRETQLIRYILGELSEREQVALEEQYFADDHFFEHILAVEDQLIDDYVNGSLSNEYRASFEQHLLTSPRMRQRVEFNRSLQQSIDRVSKESVAPLISEEKEADSLWQNFKSLFYGWDLRRIYAYASIAILIVGGLITTLIIRKDSQQPLSNRQEVREQTEEIASLPSSSPTIESVPVENSNKEQPKVRVPDTKVKREKKQSSVLAFLLSPGAIRSGSSQDLNRNRLDIPSNVKSIELKLKLEEDQYKSYRVVIQTADGEMVQWKNLLKSTNGETGKVIRVNINKRHLVKGDYMLTLSGLTETGNPEYINDYYFRVITE
jgi:hypothetical protein